MAKLQVHYGELSLNSFSVVTKHQVSDLEVKLGDKLIPAVFSKDGNKCNIRFSSAINLSPGQVLYIKV
jgi:hypothetical protein